MYIMTQEKFLQRIKKNSYAPFTPSFCSSWTALDGFPLASFPFTLLFDLKTHSRQRTEGLQLSAGLTKTSQVKIHHLVNLWLEIDLNDSNSPPIPRAQFFGGTQVGFFTYHNLYFLLG